MKQTCEECDKVFASSQSLKRHKISFHPEDEDMDNEGDNAPFHVVRSLKLAWFSDQISDSGDEEDDEIVDSEQGVVTIGEFIKEAIGDVEDEVQSVNDLPDEDVYKKISKAVENKVVVLQFAYGQYIGFSSSQLFQIRKVDLQIYSLKLTSFYRSILETIEQRSETIDDTNEAEDLAWEDRRMALKWFIKANSETLEEYLFGEDVEEEAWWCPTL